MTCVGYDMTFSAAVVVFGLHDVARSSPMAALNLSCPERASNARRFFRMTLPTAHADFDGL